jgi:succinate dehydrogenase/fumarate reductase flavoprotein subunit
MDARNSKIPGTAFVTERFDVIVVGFGYAGGVAAMAAHDAGARVLVLEKNPDAGGISVCSAGGVRIARDAGAAFDYLAATNAGTTPDCVLRTLAQGMTTVADDVRALAAESGARVGLREASGNYPFPGTDTFGFVTIDEVPGFDPARDFPAVRGSPAGARLFKLVLDGVRHRGITVRTSTPVAGLLPGIAGVATADATILAARAVVLACGGFENDAAMQRQHWQIKPVLSAAVRGNTGDGVRMAQAAGAGLWHMWHFHGSYGFRHPDPAFPFGIRMKRLPDWTPGRSQRNDVRMSWILLDRAGRRFMNEYDPYLQDTGHRLLEQFDPITQSYPRIPATLILDAAGRREYALSAPTWHDREVAARFAAADGAAFDERILVRADTLEELAAALELPPAAMADTVAAWNAACAAGVDAFERPPGSMMPIREKPFFGAKVWPIVSNTQGGPVHDQHQRVLDAFGRPIPRLFVAGELGSVFGHLYMSGGNLAECFIGGRIAGLGAAA